MRSVILQLSVEGSFADTQESRRLQLVAIQLRNGMQNSPFLQLRDGQDLGVPISIIIAILRLSNRKIRNLAREICRVNERTTRKCVRALETIFQFANVARPIV